MKADALTYAMLWFGTAWAVAALGVKAWAILCGREPGRYALARHIIGLLSALWFAVGWMLGAIGAMPITPERVLLLVPPGVLALSLTIARSLLEAPRREGA